VRSSLDAISTASNRSADQAKLVRQGLEATATALGAVGTVLDTIGTAARTKR
jgi:hypothetical protein